MQFLDSLLTWLREQNQSEDSRLHGLLDLERIAVAGHSRGAKLAALQYAGKCSTDLPESACGVMQNSLQI